VKIEFLATVAVITPDPTNSRELYVEMLGLPLEGHGDGYHHCAFPDPEQRESEHLSLLCLAGRVQLRPGLSHEPLLLEALRDAVQAGRVFQPEPCCRLAERDARLLANECEEIVSPAALAGAI
jgi:catechol 2,3-dioxygenase-like lactoylglutathione lyase family enzyme